MGSGSRTSYLPVLSKLYRPIYLFFKESVLRYSMWIKKTLLSPSFHLHNSLLFNLLSLALCHWNLSMISSRSKIACDKWYVYSVPLSLFHELMRTVITVKNWAVSAMLLNFKQTSPHQHKIDLCKRFDIRLCPRESSREFNRGVCCLN